MLKKMHIEDLHTITRFVPCNFEGHPGWPQLKEVLDAGLGESEAWEFFVTDEEAEKYGLTLRRNGRRFLKKYVQSLGKRYTIKTVRGHFQGKEGVHYQISNPVAVTKTRRKKA